MTPEEAMLKLPARSVMAVLHELAELRSRANAGEPIELPKVSVHLRGGASVRGSVLAVGTDVRGGSVLLHAMGEDAQRPLLDAVYVDPHSILAVTVHGAGLAAHLLAPEAVKSPPGAPVPTRAEVERRAAEARREISALAAKDLFLEIVWTDVEPGEPTRALAQGLDELVVALRQVLREELGAEAVKRFVRGFRINAGNSPDVCLDEGVLVLTTAVAHGLDGVLTSEQVREAIQALL